MCCCLRGFLLVVLVSWAALRGGLVVGACTGIVSVSLAYAELRPNQDDMGVDVDASMWM